MAATQTSFTFDQDRNLRAAAEVWVRENPKVFTLYEKFALQLASSGRRFGMKFLTERIRWEVYVTTKSDEFKINNNYPAYIGRMLIARHPELAAFVETRMVRF